MFPLFFLLGEKYTLIKAEFPPKELDTGFRRVFYVLHSVFPLSTDSVSSEVCFSKGRVNCWLLVLEAEAADGGHQEGSPWPSFRKSESCFCYRPEKQLAFMVCKDLFFFTSK